MSNQQFSTFAELLSATDGGTHTDEQGNQICVRPHAHVEGQMVVTIIAASGYHHSNIGQYPKHAEFLQEYYDEQVLR